MSMIPDGDILYRYANPNAFPAGQEELPLSIFTDLELSCDWEKIQAAPEFSPHVSMGRSMIVSIAVCDAIRNPVNPKRSTVVTPEWKQEIFHDPVELKVGDPFTPNASHSLIKGPKKSAVTTAIRANSAYRIINK